MLSLKRMHARRFWLLAAVLMLAPAIVHAHPMGNFSVNHYSKISLEKDRIRVQYFIDLAEIPAYQELQQGGITATEGDPAVAAFIARKGADLGRGLGLMVDGAPVAMRLVSSGVIFPPGAGGLPTMKMGFVYQAEYPAGMDRDHAKLSFADRNYEGHTGWKEIVAVAHDGSIARSTAPATDRSNGLSNYPTDMLNSPPQQLEATLEFSLPVLPVKVASTEKSALTAQAVVQAKLPSVPGVVTTERKIAKTIVPGHVEVSSPQPAVVQSAPAVVLKANRQETPRSRFTELIAAQNLSGWFLFTAAFIAIGLGGLHALEPGHGKTIVAAYLVGSRGTARHAFLLGLIVTLSHTAGVFALGAITLYASRYIVPEQLYPWLGVFSGLIIAGLGGYLFLRRVTGTATDHSHADGEGHFNWKFLRRSETTQAASSGSEKKTVSLAQLLTLGITGGIIPCPAALIVLLSAFALHRVGLGFFLIVAFSVGLAAVLIGFGMLMVYARRFMTRLQMDGPLTRKWLPLASSAFIMVLGSVLTVQAWITTHISLPTLSKERIGPLLFVIGLGLILGIRHSTDADHVVAISTIVSKQGGIRNATLIGSVWGLGHTITIFIVGSLIILFGVEIPPRLGLSMEFSVALMLILLGVLNLSGVMQKITAYLTPASAKQAKCEAADLEQSTSINPIGNPIRRLGVYQCLRPLVIGLVHGLAGSAAVALLVLSTIHNPVWASVYLLIFGAGTMIGMMCMTTAIALPFTYAGTRFRKLGQYMGVASGMVSVCFGSFLVYQLGFLGGLFTSHPHWTPQ